MAAEIPPAEPKTEFVMVAYKRVPMVRGALGSAPAAAGLPSYLNNLDRSRSTIVAIMKAELVKNPGPQSIMFAT